MRSLLIIFFSALSLLASTLVTAMTTHPLQDIRDTATNYVRANLATDDTDIHISAKALDPRLKLPLCKQQLQAHMPYSNLKSSNTTVGVRCEGEQPWSLYVPVTVQIYREVAVASRPLAQGEKISADDVEMQRMDISHLAGGYLTQANIAIGQISTRPIQLGRPLLSNLLKAPTIIRRGQTITMLAKQSSFEVRSMGESLMDGAVGERIKVRNRRSKRIVEGVVAKNGVVFIN
jgi:flagellar basal body P-ring formation protein FlgA